MKKKNEDKNVSFIIVCGGGDGYGQCSVKIDDSLSIWYTPLTF